MSEETAVAIAVIRRNDGRVLVAHRANTRHQGGRLEFPGGKIEPGEDSTAALAREMVEEIGIAPRCSAPLMTVRHRYPGRSIRLEVHEVTRWQGEVHGAEGQAIEWRDPALLRHEDFPAANRPIVAALQWPPHYLITPEPADSTPASIRAIADGVERALSDGTRLVQLRAPHCSASAWSALLTRVCEIFESAGNDACLLANADPDALQWRPGLRGVHLPTARAARYCERPVGDDQLLSCACHGPEELAHAEELAADFVVVGAVNETASHPDRPVLGWPGLQQVASRTTIPVYAVGGMRVEDLALARAHGAVGIAAIRTLWPRA